MANKISVVHGLEFPMDAVTQKFAWLGRSGSGKTYGCKRFVEQLVRAGAQVVVVDTVGVWFGLRRGERGLEIPVLGGLYGDITLESTSGELVAEVVVAHGASMVLDTSHFRDAQRSRFMEAFGRRLFELKKQSPGAMHIVLDEGQDVVPQNPANSENMMLHEWVRITKQGRAFGIGLSISSQRPQELNKKALNQTECVLAFQLTGPQERKALEYWLADKGVDTKLSERLPSLAVGTPFVWSPQWLSVADVFGKVLPIDSDDTSQTPQLGDVIPSRSQLKPIDLAKLRESMAAAQQDHEQSDPVKLKEAIKRLQQQLTERARNVSTVDTSVAEDLRAHLRNITALRLEENRDFNATVRNLKNLIEAVGKSLESVNKSLEPLVELAVQQQDPIQEAIHVAEKNLTHASQGAPGATASPGAPVGAASHSSETDDDMKPLNPLGLPRGELAVLRAVCSSPNGASLSRLSLVTGLRTRSIQNYLVSLSTGGMVERGRGITTCTQKGLHAAAPVPPAKTGKELLKMCLKNLPIGESNVLREVMDAWPNALKNQVIAERTGLSLRSVQNYLVNLSTRGLVLRQSGRASISAEVGL